ncbi:hypothetical protein B0H19DRAFT_204173 [Mycena capillaripes]|nr:hypothetical protein B0H19DRAFT_204173 [Mycena capillaripes]
MLFNAKSLISSFPALTALSFLSRDPCSCELQIPLTSVITSPPLKLFPALFSLTLVNQCFTQNIIDDILGSASQWPLLNNLTLCSQEHTLTRVGDTLLDAVRSKGKLSLPLPRLRVSSDLFSEMTVMDARTVKVAAIEISDPADVLEPFCTSPRVLAGF